MHQLAIEQLFQRYLKAFHQQDMKGIQECYQLPCTLHTPDKVVFIENQHMFEQEFLAIFEMLNEAKITQIIPLNASFNLLREHLILACVDWQFIDSNDEVFTDFSAFYYLAFNDEQWQIFNVVSHELNQSVALSGAFNITYNVSD